MMEKNGMLTLTEKDLSLYKEGKVSARLSEEWELDFNSLDGMIKAGSFELVENKSTKLTSIKDDKSGE